MQMTDTGDHCPHCDSTDTELLSPFGGQLLTAQYYCCACRTPFERVKDRDTLRDAEEYASRVDGPSGN